MLILIATIDPLNVHVVWGVSYLDFVVGIILVALVGIDSCSRICLDLDNKEMCVHYKKGES